MLFNSISFSVFFVVVLLCYYSRLSWTAKRAALLVLSYIFYAAAHWPLVSLLMISTVVDWYAAKGIANTSRLLVKRLCLLASLGVNLGLLSLFKYGNFAIDTVNTLLQQAGISAELPGLNLILPVGISFYTFQTLSYTIDVYRGRITPAKTVLDFALYVAFFPQLVAGPIVRASDFLPQCGAPRRANWRQFSWGLRLMILGIFEKVCFADQLLSPISEKLFRSSGAVDFVSAWVGTIAFSGQIYFDFAGYSTCAIGAAMCLGFGLPDNFRFPYASIGFSDFWGRWHISLSSWLRDYLYIPLGGNRSGTFGTYRNLMLTMLLGGLWHGASWTFVAWGGLHGILLVLERLFRKSPIAKWPIWSSPVSRLGLILVTYAAVCLTWVPFRADTFARASQISGAMAGVFPADAQRVLGLSEIVQAGGFMIAVLGFQVFARNKTLEEMAGSIPEVVLSLLTGAMLFALLFFSTGDTSAFIYFQF